MNIADLGDPHAVERGRQIGHWNLDAANLVVEALGGESVHRAEKRRRTGKHAGGSEKIASRGIGDLLDLDQRVRLWRNLLRFRDRVLPEPIPDTFGAVHDLDKEEGKKGAGQPKSRKHREGRVTPIQVAMAPHAKTASNGKDDQSQGKTIKKARCDPQPALAPPTGDSPDRAVPKALGKENRCQDRQADDDPKQQPAPVHRILADLVTPKFTMRAGLRAAWLPRMVAHP